MKKLLITLLLTTISSSLLCFGVFSASELGGIDLEMHTFRMLQGETKELKILATPPALKVTNATFTSSNTSVVTVDEYGVVTAVGEGEAYVTAKVENFEAKCHIFVFAEKLPGVKFMPKGKSYKTGVPVVACLGDSITTYSPGPDSGKNYHRWWADSYRIRTLDCGISGSGITSDSQNPFINRVNGTETTAGKNMPENADLIIVKGGTNNWGKPLQNPMKPRSNLSIKGALRELMETLIEKYPTTPIVFLSTIKRCEAGQTPETRQGGYTLGQLAQTIVDMAHEYGLYGLNIYEPEELDFTSKLVRPSVVDGKWVGAIAESDLMPDGLHPSGKGHKILASYLDEKLIEMGVITHIVRGMGFTDTLNHWGCDNIDVVVSKGLFNGVSDTEFNPDGKMTRGMLVTVLSRLWGEFEAQADAEITDVKADAWYALPVAWAMNNGIVEKTTVFRPDDNATREELAYMLYNYAKMVSKEGSLDGAKEFDDLDNSNPDYLDAIKFCTKNGIIGGYSDNTVKPKNEATRAEVATMIVRFDNYLNNFVQETPDSTAE